MVTQHRFERENVELTVTGRGQFAAKVTRIEFRRLWMQRFSDSLPRTVPQQALFEKT